VIGQRAGGGQRVFDRRELFDFLRRARPVAVVEVVAEEILVILIVPRIRFVALLFRFGLFGRGCGLGSGLRGSFSSRIAVW